MSSQPIFVKVKHSGPSSGIERLTITRFTESMELAKCMEVEYVYRKFDGVGILGVHDNPTG